MREHKYRAWDKNIEAMVDPENLHLDGSGLVAVYYQNCDDVESVWETDPVILEGIILLQYTGLGDSQIIEEYYGDIVIATFDGGDEWEVFVIEDGPAAVLYRNIDTDQIWYFWQMPVHYVIGNIYEKEVTK